MFGCHLHAVSIFSTSWDTSLKLDIDYLIETLNVQYNFKIIKRQIIFKREKRTIISFYWKIIFLMCKYASTFMLRYSSPAVVIAVIWQVTFLRNLVTEHTLFRE